MTTTGRDDGGPRSLDVRDGLEPGDAALVERARAAFDAEVSTLDSTTQRRLAKARRAALAGVERPARHATPVWVPVGAAAAVAIVAIGVVIALRGPGSAPAAADDTGVMAATLPGSIVALAYEPVTEVELLLGEDELELYVEDPDFVRWVAEAAGDDDAG